MKIFCLSHAFLILLSVITNAQTSRYIIEFKDKNRSQYTLNNPAAYLSAQAIARRNRQKIPVDSTDLPITPAYLDGIRSIPNVTVLSHSKWLNQVCIRTTDAEALVKINALPFVKTTLPIAARINTSMETQPDKAESVSGMSFIAGNNGAVAENIYNYGNTFDQVHMHTGEFLHNNKLRGEGMTIAILDGGFFGYKTNPVFDSVRLQNKVLGEWDFVANEQSVNEDNSHGMYCFSIMAANKPGSMVGSSPMAKYYLFRTEDVASEYPVEEQNWAAAAERADSLGVDMISSSLGYADFDNPVFNHSYAQRNGNTSVVTRAADLAAKKGMIVMNSAGNSGNNGGESKYIACPADGDSVVAVGAVDRNGNIAGFSSWGPNGGGRMKPNIVSLGQGTTIAGFDGNPVSGNGTSFSNPNIAGLIACLWQAFPELSNMAIIDAVQKSAHKYNNPDSRFGYGIPDFKKAFSSLVVANFNGNITNDKCITTLTWTAKDAFFIKYDIERKSGFDTGFVSIATITGKSDVSSTASYIFKDTLPYVSATTVQYRLKQVIGGDTSLILMNNAFNVEDICNSDQKIIVSPNPFSNNISIAINTPEAIAQLGISLYDMKGQQLYLYQGAKSNGNLTHNIPGLRLPSGAYVVIIKNGKRVIFTKKMLK